MTVADLIKADEGFRPHVYKCPAGKLSVGYGRNLEDNGITPEEAEFLLANDIANCRNRCELFIPLWGTLGEVRQACLLSMCYNLGLKGLTAFHDMLMAIHLTNWEQAATAMLDSKWHQQVGQRAERLAEMMRSGNWPT
jgi:lysozyme